MKNNETFSAASASHCGRNDDTKKLMNLFLLAASRFLCKLVVNQFERE